jgi:single-strand DNA-binding protein
MIIRPQKGSVLAQGRISKDPETRTTPTGKTVTNIDMNVSDDRNTAEWLNRVACWDDIAEYAQGLKKGDKVLLCGIEKPRTYTGRDGEEKTVNDITATFLCRQPSAQKLREPGEDPDDDCPF